MQSSNGLERLGYLLAGATAAVTLIAFLMVRDHVAAQDHFGADRLAASVSAASAATQ